MSRKIAQYFFHVGLPVATGSVIYTLWRPQTLLVFEWYETVQLLDFVIFWRATTFSAQGYLPEWTVFSFPNGCWVYALTAYMILTWQNSDATFAKLFWFSLGLLFGVGGEFLQLFGIIPGTFDPIDVFTCLIAAILAFIFVSRLFNEPLLPTGEIETA